MRIEDHNLTLTLTSRGWFTLSDKSKNPALIIHWHSSSDAVDKLQRSFLTREGRKYILDSVVNEESTTWSVPTETGVAIVRVSFRELFSARNAVDAFPRRLEVLSTGLITSLCEDMR